MMGKGGQAGESARANLAKALSDLARQAQEMGAALPSLEEALTAMQAGQIEQVLKDLAVAEKDIEKMKELAEALQQMQAQAEKIGRDLAEQLKNGQAEAAIGTLQKMANELKTGAATPERMAAMMKELSKALDPAGPYGKVPDLLKQALQQMQGGQKPQAAQSLADAAQELERLMQELADAQDLKSTMDALKRAQMCIGNCQGWGTMPGPPGSKGGKPGRGVGTWADEEGWIEPPGDTGLWDNSGIERPDRDPRGITDRGEGEVPPDMTPTKVKGQFQPGSQMPSIPLRGVSIKGQSTVGYREAAAAAQSAAESALSHDQVPRAYQGAVKGYFDDLGK
jgi:tetratricopeptide (TPR) repeat protein